MCNCYVCCLLCLLLAAPPLYVSVTTDHTRVAAGDNVTLRCNVTGGLMTDIAYLWKYEGRVIQAENNATLDLFSFSLGEAGNYTCVVTDTGGAGMDSIVIEVGGELRCV